jgi:hypothetical protein
MRLLVSGATRTLRQLNRPDRLGHLLTPHAGDSIDTLLANGLPVAADNAAFSAWDETAFVRMLAKLRGKPVIWVTAPDVVADAAATLALFEKWEPIIRSYGLPVALVAQDGLEDLQVPWGRFDALFLGGSTAWKLGPDAERLAREAKRRGKLLHGGRVNSRRRLRHMATIGCDSCDGSGFSRFPDRDIPSALRWLEEIDRQPSLQLAA